MSLRRRRTVGRQLYTIIWDSEAANDLHLVYSYHLRQSLQGAGAIINEFFSRTEGLSVYPERYGFDPDLGPPYRRIIVRYYRLIYRIDKRNRRVSVLKIWNSKRDGRPLRDA